MDTSGFSTGAQKINQGFSKIGAAAKKLAVAFAGAIAVGKLIQFGKEAIDLGSDLSEVQNVVDVTFGSMSEDVNEFARNAITQFGLSETSAKRYSSTMGAMLKSMGFSIGEAKDMSTTLAGLAGDMASFYNLSGEEAFAKIRSGISGETEPLKQLGINLSVANLEQYALTKGIKKSYSAMTQQEQALLRYNYLLSVTSDAQGDFARTSDSWANQTRILSERFNSLKAAIGQGLINLLTPVLKIINAIISRLQVAANAFKSFSELLTGKKAEETSGSNTELAGAYDEVTESVEEAAAAEKEYLSGLDEIRKYSDADVGIEAGITEGTEQDIEINVGGATQGKTMIDDLAESMERLREKLVPLGESWDNLKNKMQPVVDLIKSDLKWAYDNVLVPLGNWTIGEALPGGLNALAGAASGLKWVYENVLVPFGSWTINEALPLIIEDLGKAFEFVRAVLVALQPLFTWLWNYVLAPLGKAISEVALGILKAFGGVLDFLTGVFTGDWDLAFAGLQTTAVGLRDALFGIFKFIKGIFVSFDEWLQGVFATDWEYYFGAFEGVVKGFFGVLEGIWLAAKGVFLGIIEFIEGVFTGDWEKAWNGIATFFGGIWDGIWTVVKGVINLIIGALNLLWEAVYAVVSGIVNALGGIADGIGSLFGQKWKFSMPSNVPTIPYLAKGAVIPPNAPFLAVQGEQRHGTNIEAPLDTIKDAVRQVMREGGDSGSGNTYRFTAQINRRTLFDEFIAEAKMRKSATGRDPFALA